VSGQDAVLNDVVYGRGVEQFEWIVVDPAVHWPIFVVYLDRHTPRVLLTHVQTVCCRPHAVLVQLGAERVNVCLVQPAHLTNCNRKYLIHQVYFRHEAKSIEQINPKKAVIITSMLDAKASTYNLVEPDITHLNISPCSDLGLALYSRPLKPN